MDLSTWVGFDEDLDVSKHHDVYPAIDPAPHFAKQTLKGKVVLITGASRGIGKSTAIIFARAGASLSLAARSQAGLEETKALILKEVPQAPVLLHIVDVKDTAKAENAVKTAIDCYGRLDVLIANSAAATRFEGRVGDKDPDAWWNSFEINIKGVFNFVRPAITHLQETNGRIVVVGAGASQVRVPFASDYCVSKHALIRFVEYIATEYPKVKTFNVHPGIIVTELARSAIGLGEVEPPKGFELDTLELPGSVMLYLATGSADWLSGRYCSVNWDMNVVEREWKEKIVKSGALVSKLYIPK